MNEVPFHSRHRHSLGSSRVYKHRRSLHTAQEIVDQLRKNGHITPVYARRLEEAATLRNRAAHAEWDEFDIRDVGSAIKTVRDMIEQHLDR